MKLRRRWWSVLILVGGLLAAYQIFDRALLYRYRPACGGWLEDPIDAPLRRSYADDLDRYLTEEGHRFRRRGDDIYLPFRDATFSVIWLGDLHNYFINDEIKIAASVASGYENPPRRAPPPPAVQRLITRREAETGQRLPRDAEGYITYEAALRLPDCDLKRAALTLADDTPEERAAQGHPGPRSAP